MAAFTAQRQRSANANWQVARLAVRLLAACAALAITVWLTGCASAPTRVSSELPDASLADDGPAAAPSSQATSPSPTGSPEEAAILVPTVTGEPEKLDVPTQETVWANTVTVEGDYYIRGNPAAPVRLIDYSDFL